MGYKAVIFDLDGVIVSTDNCHFLAWKRLSDEEKIYFDRKINERLRGVSRMESLEILLERAEKSYSPEEKLLLAQRKNGYYVELLRSVSPEDILPGVLDFLSRVKKKGLKTAIGSSSKNAGLILERIGLSAAFDAIADGNRISRSKPDPEVFLKAAEMLNLPPADCLVAEDANAGVEAGLAAGMDTLGLGFASNNKSATYTANGLNAEIFKRIFEGGRNNT